MYLLILPSIWSVICILYDFFLQSDVTLNKSKALAALAPKAMFVFPGEAESRYDDILEGVIHPLPVRDVPALVLEATGGSRCQADIISVAWHTAGTMVHILR